MFIASEQVSKSGAVMRVCLGFFFNICFFWFADILGQMEQHTAMRTKGVQID